MAKKTKERARWLVALLLCLCCMGLCVSIMVAPTVAAEETLSAAQAQKIREDYAGTEGSLPEDVTIVKYYGTYGTAETESELVLLQLKGVYYPSVVRTFVIGDYTFDFAPEGVLVLHNGSKFYTLEKAYEQKVLSDNDLKKIVTRFGGHSTTTAAPTTTTDPATTTKAGDTTTTKAGDTTATTAATASTATTTAAGNTTTTAAGTTVTTKAGETTTKSGETTTATVNIQIVDASNNWGGSNSRETLEDASGNKLANSYLLGDANAANNGVITWGVYDLKKNYLHVSGKLAPSKLIESDVELQVKFYANGTAVPFYTSPVIKRTSEGIRFSESVKDVHLLKIEVSKVGGTGKSASLLVSDMPFTTDPNGPTTAIAPTTAAPTGTTYKEVAGFKHVYEVLENGASKSPKAYVYGLPAVNVTVPAYEKGGKYYIEALGDSVFVAINPDGTLNLMDAVWAGEDKRFGTSDDMVSEVTKVGEVLYYQLMENGVKMGKALELLSKIKEIGNLLRDPDATTTTAAGTTVTTTATLTAPGQTTTQSPLLTTTKIAENGLPGQDGGSLLPDTGLASNPAIAVCLVILLMGSCYCGYRFFRKDEYAQA